MTSPIESWSVEDAVYSVTVSPDGACLAAAVGTTVMMWHVHNGQVTLHGHTDLVKCVAFSPDGSTLASGSFDCTIRLWNTESGNNALGPLCGHTSSIDSVAFSDDGNLLISGSGKRMIRIWDAYTGYPAGKTIQANGRVMSVAISPDSRKIFGALGNKIIEAYDTITGTFLFKCVGHVGVVNSVATSPNGRLIISASDDQTVRVWDGATGAVIGSPLWGHTHSVQCAVFSSDGKYIVSASWDNTIRIWDSETGAMRSGLFHDHTSAVWAVTFTPDGKHLISGSDDRTIKIWDVSSLGIQPRRADAEMEEDVQMIAVEEEITGTTTLKEIIARLVARGCADLTSQLDLATCSIYPISSGGFGDIYRCKTRDETEVAIKTVRLYVGLGEQEQKHLKYAAREIYALAKCRHPNVQPLLGLVIFRDQLGMITAWERNGSLPQYLERHPSVDRCTMSTLISEGLVYLHASGVIHGDLKGANVLISQDGIPQLADFGNAVLQDYTLKFSKTSTKEALSLRWAAPELFEGGTRSVPADVYALGMTILETITGDIPWVEKSEHAVIRALLQGTYPDRLGGHIPVDSEHGEMLWLLLKRCWDGEPSKRPSALEVKEAISRITPSGLSRG